MPASFATFTPPATMLTELLSDGHDVVSAAVTVATGVFVRGEIANVSTAGALAKPVAATDCNCIVVDDVDASGGAKSGVIYKSGKFKADAVTWPGALAHFAVSESLRDTGIQIESVVGTTGITVKAATPEELKEADEVEKMTPAERAEYLAKKQADIYEAARKQQDVEDAKLLPPEEREKYIAKKQAEADARKKADEDARKKAEADAKEKGVRTGEPTPGEHHNKHAEAIKPPAKSH